MWVQTTIKLQKKKSFVKPIILKRFRSTCFNKVFNKEFNAWAYDTYVIVLGTHSLNQIDKKYKTSFFQIFLEPSMNLIFDIKFRTRTFRYCFLKVNWIIRLGSIRWSCNSCLMIMYQPGIYLEGYFHEGGVIEIVWAWGLYKKSYDK